MSTPITANVASLSADLSPALGWLLRASAEAAGIALLVLLAQAAFGRWLTPAWRHRLWGLVALRLLLPASPASPASVWNLAAGVLVPPRAATPGPGEGSATASTTATTPAASASAGPAATGGRPTVVVRYGPVPLRSPAGADEPAAGEPAADRSAVMPAAAATGRTVPTDPPAPPSDAAAGATAARPSGAAALAVAVAVAGVVWLAGAVLLLARLVGGHLAFARRLRRSAEPVTDPATLALLADGCRRVGLARVPPLLETDAVRGPAAAGVRRPCLLVPPGLLPALSPAERRVVLLHELAHVRHRDVAANWLLAVLQVVHWFNPVVWLAFARLRADREFARDAAVLALADRADADYGSGDENAGDVSIAAADGYARTLLKLVERLSAGPAPAGGGFARRAASSPGTAGIVGDGLLAADAHPLAPGLLGRRGGLKRRLRLITGFPAAARRFAPAGPALFLALGVGTLTGPSAAEPAAAPAPVATRPAGTQPAGTVEAMIARTRKLASDGRDNEALAEIERILAVDPRNDYALGTRELIVGRRTNGFRQQRKYVEQPATGPATEPAPDLDKQVEALVAEARRATRANDYQAAIAAVDKILFRDPRNEYATGVRPLLEDRLAAQNFRAARDDFARDAGPSLDRKLPEVVLDKVAFSEAIDFVRDVSRYPNAYVHWKALEAAGVTRGTPVTVRLYNVKTVKALDIILGQVARPDAPLDWTIEDGVLTVSTAADLGKDFDGARARRPGGPPAAGPAGIRPAAADKASPVDHIVGDPPAGWSAVRATGPAAGPAADEDPDVGAEERVVRRQLERKLPAVKFDNVGFEDAIDYFREVTGTNIFVNWKALEAAGIKRDATVALRIYNVKFSKALNIVLESVSKPKARLGYTIDEGVISISTANDLAKNVLTRVYDIRDLLIDVPNYTDAPDLGLDRPAASSPGTRPAAPASAATRPSTKPASRPSGGDDDARAAVVDQVIRLITETVAPDTWRDAGGDVGAIKELSGQLIVTQTPANLMSIAALLAQLRENKSVQTTVEGRFISCDDDAVEELIGRWRKEAAAAAGPATGPATAPATAPTAGGDRPPPAGVFLTDAQVDEFLRFVQATRSASVVTAPRMTLFNGQRAYVTVSTQTAYVRDHATVVGPGGEVRYEPVHGVVDAGVTLDVQATASADRRYVTLTLRPKLSALRGMDVAPWPGRPAGSALTVQVPRLKISELRTTLSVPDGGAVLLGGMEDPGPPPATDDGRQAMSRDPRYVALKVRADEMDASIVVATQKLGASNEEVVRAKKLRDGLQRELDLLPVTITSERAEVVPVPTTGPATVRTSVTVPAGGTLLPARPATAPAATRPAAPVRRMYLLMRPRLIVQREVEQRQFPLLRTRDADGPQTRPAPSR